MKEEKLKYLLKEFSRSMALIDEKMHRLRLLVDPGAKKEPARYRVISEKEVSEKFLIRAEKILNYCLKILKLQNVEIEWIEFAGFSDSEVNRGQKILEWDDLIYGQAIGTSKVLLRHDVPLKDMEFTLAHELHHLWFRRKHGDEYKYEEETYMWEQTADRFARKVLYELWDLEHQDFPWPITFLGKN